MYTSCKTESEEEIKTSFSNCDELIHYVKYYSYETLKSQWGEGEIGKPYNSSGFADQKEMMVGVVWKNINVNGKHPEIIYTNASDKSDWYYKNPSRFWAAKCE